MFRSRPPRRRLRRAAAVWAFVGLAAAPPGAAQVVFRGLVTDPAGRPLADVDLDFWDAQSGTRIDPSAPGWEGQEDKTDVFGFYEMVVKPEVYHVRWEPPPERTDLAAVRLLNIVLGQDTVQNVTLPSGVRLQGLVVDPTGAPVADVDLDFRDPETGTQLATSVDNTGSDGRYATTVIPGIWDIVFKPPPGAGAAALSVDGFDLSENAVLDVTLPRGVEVRGRIESESGFPLANIDLDVEETTGRHVPTPDDNTDFGGRFLLTVPEGTFHVFAVPPRGLPLAPAALYDVFVDRDVDLGTIVLSSGVLVTGTARDPDGVPLADADLDLRQPGTCDLYPLVDDRTDGTGAFALRIEPGTYDVIVNPAPGSALPAHRLQAVDLLADGSRDLVVPTWAPQHEVVAARVTDLEGRGLPDAVVRGEPLGAGESWSATTGSDGAFSRSVVAGRYRLDVQPPDGEHQPLRLASLDLPCELPAALPLNPVRIVIPSTRAIRTWPNPWGSSASIALDMSSAESDATLEIYDVTGRKVRTLFRGALPAGTTDLRWDGRNDRGRPVASGFYVLRLTSDRTTLTRKITRIRRQ